MPVTEFLEVCTQTGNFVGEEKTQWVGVGNIEQIIPRQGSHPCCELQFTSKRNLIVFESMQSLITRMAQDQWNL